jgi:hypothetical protein
MDRTRQVPAPGGRALLRPGSRLSTRDLASHVPHRQKVNLIEQESDLVEEPRPIGGQTPIESSSSLVV